MCAQLVSSGLSYHNLEGPVFGDRVGIDEGKTMDGPWIPWLVDESFARGAVTPSSETTQGHAGNHNVSSSGNSTATPSSETTLGHVDSHDFLLFTFLSLVR